MFGIYWTRSLQLSILINEVIKYISDLAIQTVHTPFCKLYKLYCLCACLDEHFSCIHVCMYVMYVMYVGMYACTYVFMYVHLCDVQVACRFWYTNKSTLPSIIFSAGMPWLSFTVTANFMLLGRSK